METGSTPAPYERRAWSRPLDGDPHSAATARAFVAGVLSDHDAVPVDDAVLVTSELVTNALKHGRAPVRITVTVGGRDEPPLVIDVTDGSPELPGRRLPGESGRFGLWIAEELAAISVHPTDEGKTVRATFGRPEHPSHPLRT